MCKGGSRELVGQTVPREVLLRGMTSWDDRARRDLSLLSRRTIRHEADAAARGGLRRHLRSSGAQHRPYVSVAWPKLLVAVTDVPQQGCEGLHPLTQLGSGAKRAFQKCSHLVLASRLLRAGDRFRGGRYFHPFLLLTFSSRSVAVIFCFHVSSTFDSFFDRTASKCLASRRVPQRSTAPKP